MPSGIQVWDAGGNMVVDTSTNVAIYLGRIVVTSANLSGSVVVPEWNLPGATPVYFYSNSSFGGQRYMRLSHDGQNLSWSPGGTRSSPTSSNIGFILYGLR